MYYGGTDCCSVTSLTFVKTLPIPATAITVCTSYSNYCLYNLQQLPSLPATTITVCNNYGNYCLYQLKQLLSARAVLWKILHYYYCYGYDQNVESNKS